MNYNILKKHDPEVFRRILLTFTGILVLLSYISCFSILKNLFLTINILSHQNAVTLFHGRIAECLVFSLNSVLIYLMYWIIFTILMILPFWCLSFFKIPQYLIKIMMFMFCSFILAYLYTNAHFYSFTHKHLHEIWSSSLFQSQFFKLFFQALILFSILTLVGLMMAENYYFKYSIQYLEFIFVFSCTVLLVFYSVFLSVKKFHHLKLYQTYIQHYIGLSQIFNMKYEDNFIYVENGPIFSNNRLPPPIYHKHNIVLIGIKNLTQQHIKANNIPSISQFQKENLNFIKHISVGTTVTENLFGLLYGLPVNYLPSILFNHTEPLLFTSLQKNGYRLYALPSSSLQPLSHEKLPEATFPERIFASKNKHPFFIFYQLNIDIEHPLMSFAVIEEKINHLLLSLKSTRQYQHTIIIITGLTTEKDSYTPFVMHWPQMDTPKTIEKVSCNYDILSTLLPGSINISFGLNLLDLKNNRIIPSKVGTSFLQVVSKSNKIYVQPLESYDVYQKLFKYEKDLEKNAGQ